MSAIPPTQDRRCHADPDCCRPPCFQAQLYRAHQDPGQSPVVKTHDTCADHLGDTVQALTRWARTTGFGSGILQVSAVCTSANEEDEHLLAFPFATIPIPA
jgi:hypothetical protein